MSAVEKLITTFAVALVLSAVSLAVYLLSGADIDDIICERQSFAEVQEYMRAPAQEIYSELNTTFPNLDWYTAEENELPFCSLDTEDPATAEKLFISTQELLKKKNWKLSETNPVGEELENSLHSEIKLDLKKYEKDSYSAVISKVQHEELYFITIRISVM